MLDMKISHLTLNDLLHTFRVGDVYQMCRPVSQEHHFSQIGLSFVEHAFEKRDALSNLKLNNPCFMECFLHRVDSVRPDWLELVDQSMTYPPLPDSGRYTRFSVPSPESDALTQ